ncbi:DUF3624 domain-containing protein [Shewanella metallivivens]|uniref:DUF3624 domain-containing protein n=1 Tax=Shewanella metallivivens TaxID=2872342 RepID=A0ABT5TJF7_9GAMM|nr:DUF3624 domain-containing protein [Shewanella metallivivens]MDD8057855.1 DUF3624 domain-containing protein [Shewanella metallivivens]
MACEQCTDSIFRQKIGRCQRCMVQLTVLSILTWPIWWRFFVDQPKTVESIALLFFAISFTGLLCLHLLVWCYRRLYQK